ncbi:MAG: hypothetical protein ACI8TE_000094 [Francisella sp.]|jgi:hypothetical protein
MLDTKTVIINFSEDDLLERGMSDMRKVLNNFSNQKKINLSQLIQLNHISSYYMYSAIFEMNKMLNPNYDESKGSPLLDSCKDFIDICELLEDPLRIDSIRSMTDKKRLSASRVPVTFEDNPTMEQCIADIREILTSFKKHNQASLYDVCILSRSCNYLLGNGVLKLFQILNGSFDDRKQKHPVFNILAEYSMMCEFLLIPEKAMQDLPEFEDDDSSNVIKFH